jgi:hypothetical protein
MPRSAGRPPRSLEHQTPGDTGCRVSWPLGGPTRVMTMQVALPRSALRNYAENHSEELFSKTVSIERTVRAAGNRRAWGEPARFADDGTRLELDALKLGISLQGAEQTIARCNISTFGHSGTSQAISTIERPQTAATPISL